MNLQKNQSEFLKSSKVETLPSSNEILADLRYLIARELKMMKNRCSDDIPLEDKDIRKLESFAKVATSLGKEERESEIHSKANALTDDELKLLVETYIKANPHLLK